MFARTLHSALQQVRSLADDWPKNDFWSVIVYDNQTCSMLQTDQQFPSVSSQTRDFWSMPTARWMSILDPKLRSEKRTTGADDSR